MDDIQKKIDGVNDPELEQEIRRALEFSIALLSNQTIKKILKEEQEIRRALEFSIALLICTLQIKQLRKS